MAFSDTCFDSAFLHLEFLKNNISSGKGTCDVLSNKIRYLRTFYLLARRWGNDYVDDYENDAIVSLGALLVEIEDAVSTIAQDVQYFCLICREREGLWCRIVEATEKVDSFNEKINRWYFKFSDCSGQSTTSACCSGYLVEFIDSILSSLNYRNYNNLLETLMHLLEALEEELTFLKNVIRFFAALQGEDGDGDDDDRHLGQNLLTHIKAVAINAAHHFYMLQFAITNDEDKIPKMKIKISELLQRIKPVDPHVSQIYVQSLNDLISKKQPRSMVTLEILQDFFTFLLSHLFEILRSGTTPVFSNKYRLHILYQGLRSLSIILKKQPKNFDERMRDLTGVVACNAGVVIFSFFGDAIEHSFAPELSDLLEKINLIRAEIAGISPQTGGLSMLNFPKVDELGFVDFLIENLTELISCEEAAATSTAIPKNRVQTIHKELVFLRSILGKIVQLRDEKEEVRTLLNHVVELAYRLEFLIDSLVIGDVPNESSCQTSFASITQEIDILKLDALKISDKGDLNDANRSNDFLSSEGSVPIIKEDIIRMDDEVNSIMDGLKSREQKLQIVSIVGMPGSGKTTLAKLVYNDSLIKYHFHIRAWCCISQVYDRKNLLLEILKCISGGLSETCEEKLAHFLQQNLRRKKYLIVLDDVWNIDAWNILKYSFPDNRNGSRILLTSRLQEVARDVVRDVAGEEILDREPHCLRRLNDNESWKLLKSKLFFGCEWPPTLSELGTQIVKRCNGLPLMIVILAGILATKEQNDWEEVVEHCLSSSSTDILEQCNKILELSYTYLPDKLKPCLLYFGAFPEDREHTASELTLLWIAEGFVRKTHSKSLENEAKDYLMELKSRSLIMVDKQSSTGMIKTCRIHDLLHVFCLEKAKEKKNFFQLLKGYDELSDFSESQNVSRLCIYCRKDHLKKSRLSCPQLRSLLFCHEDSWHNHLKCGLNPLSYIGNSKLVKVLDMRQIYLFDIIPNEITLMIQLRYLAVRGHFRCIPSPIANLSNLETLILDSSKEIELPLGFWKLKKLRHLEATKAVFIFRSEDLGNSVELLNLETFFTLGLSWGDRERVLKKFPNIRKLKVKFLDYGASAESGKNKKILVLDSFIRLESLKISVDKKQQIDICFPKNLRKLTLVGWCLPRCKISAIGQLSELEVLKLIRGAFEGEIWNMKEANQFQKLKFLKLHDIDIVRWTASDSVRDHFPCLEKLVLKFCYWLEKVPSCLEDISSLQMIEVFDCSKSVASSVKKVCKEQVDMGNEDLKVLLEDCDCSSDDADCASDYASDDGDGGPKEDEE